MTVDLAAKPFHLDADAERWVRETIASLTLEEKVGQQRGGFISFARRVRASARATW